MVFANREVVRRVNQEFIPVALKARDVNSPPSGIEGKLFAEIGRSKPAPQGICTANSDGKVLAWALSFDDDKSILKFLDHVVDRYREDPDASEPVTAQRFLKFPSRRYPDVADNGIKLRIPSEHVAGTPCPSKPIVDREILVGTIVGRALDKNGKPLSDTTRQENYMEARFQIGMEPQRRLAEAAANAKGERFAIPESFVRSLVGPAYLGQLDVDPLAQRFNVRNRSRYWKFYGRVVETSDEENESNLRIQIEGQSNVEGGPTDAKNQGGNPNWMHRVTLNWYGFVDLKDHRISQLNVLAAGDEKLEWLKGQFESRESYAQHLMAGHSIDVETAVRYGLTAKRKR